MSAISAMRAIPGLPGAAYISGSGGLAARASTSACSRPPLPTTITRTALGPDPLYNRLVPLWSDADHAKGSPDLRGLPVVLPYSFPVRLMISPVSSRSSVGKGPSPTLVVYALVTPITRSSARGGMPAPTHAPPADGLEEGTNG